jgi:eukaryotic-like serine/threonine-protein kinase
MTAPALPGKLAGRYEIRQILGEGGMGLVYRAYDTVIRREVALKTIRDIPEPAALQLFYKESDVLASMSHPNIVEIFDIGEFEEDGKRKPYFVMPLLPGTTLDNLIRNASHRLTVERTVEIIAQACRGLQAAHERGLVHRDLKPSNIFVMEDDSVKIIDFGVAHITDAASTMGQKGTLLYMSPEQIEMKPLSALSDVFSISVVCYEALTGRQPFRRALTEEIVEAILRLVPPPASDLNAAVNDAISRVVHKGMAKQPWHRFATARDFSDALNRALRNQPIEFFDPVRIRPRLQRAAKALEDGDFQFAGEILGELEAEGHIDSSIALLRQQLDGAARQKTIAKLLEIAKSRFDEEEDPLALQKIQEVLQIDPQNVAALALKSKIESRRGQRQIDNWYKLASQHIENHAYVHAREALANVLQLNPNEARAHQLLAEIDRQEQQYNKLRQEKAQLHQAAMEAWKNGEVSTALTKLALVLDLDRRAPDSSNPERSATYQSFYNKVRSEHDAINNAYAEANKCLGERSFAKALVICQTYLEKYPNNALFQALKFDVEEQQRQELSSFIASVDRQVEGEPDLDKRVNIIKEALTHYPGETHFERALRLVQDKRDLVNSIVARAHLHEEQGLFNEALSDWEVLRTIYPQYPGLKFELERLQRRREQQALSEGKARWVEQIDACMHCSEYARALELLQRARAEFPDDSELLELEKVAQDGLERASEAQRLMTDGQDLCSQNRFQEGIKLLRQAYGLDEHSAVARAVLCNALVEQSRTMLDTNWEGAEALIQQALDLNPGHPLAKSMRTLVLDRKREDFINQCIQHARRLQAAADFQGALNKVEEGLKDYPQNPRLMQIRESLQRDLALAQQRQTRRKDLEEVRRLEKEAEKTRDESATRAFDERVKDLATAYPDDPEFQAIAQEVHSWKTLDSLSSGSPPSSAEAQSARPGATMLFSPGVGRSVSPPPPPEKDYGETGAPAAKAGQAAAPARAPMPTPPAKRPSAFSKLIAFVQTSSRQVWLRGVKLIPRATAVRPPIHPRKMVAIGAVSLVLLVVIGWSIGRIITRPKRQVAIAPLTATVRTSPPGAVIVVNGQESGVSELTLKLAPGTYNVVAQLDGYEPAVGSLEVKAGNPASLDLLLQPMLPALRVSADVGAGKIWFDDNPVAEMDGAQWTLDKISSGEHKLKFADAHGGSSFAFSAEAGALPSVKVPITSNGFHTLVVSSFASRLQVYCSYCPAKLSLDGQGAIDIAAEGVELRNVSAGAHKISITRGKDSHTVEIDVGAAPLLATYVESDQNIGTLLVITGEDKVQVFLNGQAYKQSTKAGQLRIPSLDPKEYVVRVAKAGFQEMPEQRVQVRKGEEARVSFSLKPLLRLASLLIQGGLPGTEVLLDQEPVGSLGADGSLHLPTVSPGEHTVQLRKENFKPKQIQERFTAGSELTLAGSEVSLEPAAGTLQITFSPPDADVTLSRAGETTIKVVSGTPFSVSPGTYTLTARTSDKRVRTSSVEIAAGETKSLNLPLGAGGMSDWEVPDGGWRAEKSWFVRKGGDFVGYRTTPTSGSFVFSALLTHGHRLQWVLNYTDKQNYVLFQIDEDYFYRSEVVNGQVVGSAKVPHKSDKKKFRTIQIVVSPSQITNQIWEENAWLTLDSYSSPGTNLAAGKFGFIIPGSDELALSNFSHYADLSLK